MMTRDEMMAAMGHLNPPRTQSAGYEIYVYDEAMFRASWIYESPEKNPRTLLSPRPGVLGGCHAQCQTYASAHYDEGLELYACNIKQGGRAIFHVIVVYVSDGVEMALSMKMGMGTKVPFAVWASINKPFNEIRCKVPRVRARFERFMDVWDAVVARKYDGKCLF